MIRPYTAMDEANDILSEAERLNPPFEPVGVPDDVGYEATCYVAKNDIWTITVFSFDISDQGFPKGSRGHDGAVRKGSTIVRMPRDVAKRIFEKAANAPRAYLKYQGEL